VILPRSVDHRRKTIVTVGEILVEVMATRRGQTVLEPGALVGPYPSGAPAIFIDQVARLGQPCGMIGCVGDDDFGALNVERLRADGVDVSAISVHRDAPTGSAFVTYQENGDRHFVFNILHSASGHVSITDTADALLGRADHLHVMGTSLISPKVMEAMREAVRRVKARGGTISFDPNSRKKLATGSDLAAFVEEILFVSDIVMPSGSELRFLTAESDEPTAIAALLGRGVGAVVIKRGAQGATYYDQGGAIHGAPFAAEEVDPTGAGDCFGATFVVCHLRSMTVAESLRYANASGAHKVLFRGPMEGVASFPELDAWLAGRPVA
jgi:sugar/nucleoside kinase (ribokinase family)